MMFAQLETVSGESIKNFALIVAGALAIAYYAKEIFWSKGKQEVQVQQPVQVTINEELHEIFASKTEFETHVRDYKDKHREIWLTLRGENQRLEAEMTRVREGVAAMKASNEFQNQTLAAVQSDIKQLLRRS